MAAYPPIWRPVQPQSSKEERRLLYVAMTRAKDQLTLMVPQRFYTLRQSRSGDKHLYAARSRFIPQASRAISS